MRASFAGESLPGYCRQRHLRKSEIWESEEEPLAVTALQHIRKMRGGAQSHMMRCSDGHFYAVKFQNNPQHLRVLVNELLATKLAERVGLPVPVTEIIEVNEWLVANSPELNMHVSGQYLPCAAGLQLGARFVIDPMEGQIFDFLPESQFDRVRNIDAFAGMLALDKWTGNSNGRQAVFWKKTRERKFTATFIDQGYCFNAGEWDFPDSPWRGVYARNFVYQGVRGWESFAPWLTHIENFDPAAIWGIAELAPPEWYLSDLAALEQLVETLARRRNRVRELIIAFRESSRDPFPNWQEKVFTAGVV